MNERSKRTCRCCVFVSPLRRSVRSSIFALMSEVRTPGTDSVTSYAESLSVKEGSEVQEAGRRHRLRARKRGESKSKASASEKG